MSPKTEISDALFFKIFETKRRKSDERKLRIVEATIRCIATQGFENTTFEAIGKLVKMERAHVNYYFANRGELIRTAVRYAVALGQEITIEHAKNAKSFAERLTAVVEGPFYWFERYPHHAPVMGLFHYFCTYDPEYRAVQNAIRAGGEARLRAVFQPLVEAEKLTDGRATELARIIQSLMTGQLQYSLSSDFPLPPKQLRKQTVALVLEMVERATAR